MEPNQPEPGSHPDRWTLIRDLAVLQAKLIVDGFRDLLLVPASLVAGIWSLVSGDKDRPGPQFYQLISLGKQSERINISRIDLETLLEFGECSFGVISFHINASKLSRQIDFFRFMPE